MPIVEQVSVVKAPMPIVMEALNDVASIPTWATVTGTINNIKGNGRGMTYDWRYTIDRLDFSGSSEVIEQTQETLITQTTGDIVSLWTITLTPTGKHSTAIHIVVEYTPPSRFLEPLADLVLQRLNDPEVAKENLTRFKIAVEERARAAKEQIIAGY